MNTLAEVWGHVKALLADGISIIPVRDKDEIKAGDTYVAKSPYAKWKEFQNRQVTEDELWVLMEEKDTTAIAIICGKISGNIEVVDIDVKYKPGIDAILMNDLRTFYPDLFSRLRIHKTPSGGFHIIYRVSGGDVPGNLKLAGRIASEAEIELQKAKGVKRPNKEINFLETRGEGGYILSPPSMGYSLHNSNPIPVITWEERSAIIALCQTYNEIVREAPKPKVNKSQESIYDENPFEHYNNETDPSQLLGLFGWKFSHENQHFIWYTRPDKDKGVSASWNKDKRIFFIFTSSTELQANRGYHPATILAELKFDGDKSKTYYYLTQNGYGKVKKKVEQAILKKSVLSGGAIPANFSPDAKQTFEELKITIQEDHPHGIFWEQDENDKVFISREGIYQVSAGLGFQTFAGDIVQTVENIVYKRTERFYFDSLKQYIREEDANLYEDICNSYEAFIQKSGKFTIERLTEIDEKTILSDDKNNAYKCYQNGYLQITADEITFNKYPIEDKLIWDHSIQKREYKIGSSGKYISFLKLAVVDFDQALKILGYLTHEYKDETTGFIIVLTEQCPDPKQGGGSGKNVFCNLLKLSTTYTSKPGAQAKFDEKFFQSWNGQKIFGISDVPKNFDFAFLKEPSTGTFILKKLFKDEVEVSNDNAPKFIVQTNFSYEISDGGLKRRIIPLEFTGFFTAVGGVDVHFNSHFPNGWNDEDYAGYDNLIATGIQEWLKSGRKLQATELTESGWTKQWEQTYGNATPFILEYWDSWLTAGYITNEKFKQEFEKHFNDNNVLKHYWPSAIKLNLAIEAYAKHNDVPFIKDKTIRFSNGTFKARVFTDADIDVTDPEQLPF
jgi:hypothetical protein